MSKIGNLWIVGVCALIAGVTYLFFFVKGAVVGIGMANLMFLFVSILIGAPVGMRISGMITGKMCDSKFSIHKAIIGTILAFFGCYIGGFGIGTIFAFKVTPLIYGEIPEGAGFLMIPGFMGGAIGGAIGGYSREIKTGIIGGAIGGLFSSTLTGIEPVRILELYGEGYISQVWDAGTIGGLIFTHLSNGIIFGIVGIIAGASLGMISGAIGRIIAKRLNKNPHR